MEKRAYRQVPFYHWRQSENPSPRPSPKKGRGGIALCELKNTGDWGSRILTRKPTNVRHSPLLQGEKVGMRGAKKGH
jgi:hypothetical protein